MMQPAQHKDADGICAAFQTVTTAELNGARCTQSLKCVSDSKLAGACVSCHARRVRVRVTRETHHLGLGVGGCGCRGNPCSLEICRGVRGRGELELRVGRCAHVHWPRDVRLPTVREESSLPQEACALAAAAFSYCVHDFAPHEP